MTPLKRIKSLVHAALDHKGLELRRRSFVGGPALPIRQILVERCLQGHAGRAVLQIGANDGVLNDPVREMILRHDLPAVLVEPLPDVYERLKTNYADHKWAQCMNVAVGTRPGKAVMYRIRPDVAGCPDWVHGLASFQRSVLLKHRDWPGVDRTAFEKSIEEISVPVMTVSEILDAAHVSDFMMLQIDTEGNDLDVLKSAADCHFFPRIIVYEHKHLGYAAQREAWHLLAGEGYTFVAEEADTIAFRHN
jgi:FkbM family methyltransferase